MSSRLRISGLVRLANHVRQQLTQPLSSQQLEQLREHVDASLTRVRHICAQHNATPDDLPAPSRKAFTYLAGIDWEQISVDEQADATAHRPETVSYEGRQADLKRIMRRLGCPNHYAHDSREQIHAHIRAISDHIEQDLQRNAIPPERLTEPTRQARGWLALLAQEEYFQQYVQAVEKARHAVEQALQTHQGSLRPPVHVWFEPMKPPAKIRRERDGTLLQCRTPMISFSEADFSLLADLMVHRRRNNAALYEAMLGEAYQAIDAELEALGGIVEQGAGVHHDLAAAFERVNNQYFHGGMTRPRLVWSHRLTHRKFGHYDPIHDTVMISATLDQDHVPAFVVDYLLYHELLHKYHGIHWHNGRAHAHTAAFQADERRFDRREEAEQALRQLARQ